MDSYKKGSDGTYKKQRMSVEEKAILWHLARFMFLKWGIIIGINRLAKNLRMMEDKRKIVDLLKRIDETADKLKGMEP